MLSLSINKCQHLTMAYTAVFLRPNSLYCQSQNYSTWPSADPKFDI
jgi:hypothetical protein